MATLLVKIKHRFYRVRVNPTHIDHGVYAEKVRKLSDAALRYTIRDAQAAIKAHPTGHKAGYYADEINYCASELARRRKNPERSAHQILTHIHHLRDLQHQQRRGSEDHHKLGEIIALERQRLAQKLKKNPLSKGKSKAAISKNIKYLMHHPGELTAKTKQRRHKQAIAIALSVWRKATGKKRRK